MLLKISEVAKLSGITVRTLHYYDEIGLLKPNAVSDSGYREYDNESLDKLKQILFFRELDFPLKDIIKIMHTPGYDAKEVLESQKAWLTQERNRLNRLIQLADKSIKGEIVMDFEAFDKSKLQQQSKQYAKEAQERWGTSREYQQSKAKTASYDDKKWAELKTEMEEIMALFSKNRSLLPDSREANALVDTLKNHISKSYYECSNEVLLGLGEMYVADERFTKNIDKHGEGTAAFIAAAIAAYCKIRA